MAAALTHLGSQGEANMVDVGDKPVTDREAVARGSIAMSSQARRLIKGGGNKKGDPIQAARLAGIMAAKKKPVQRMSLADAGIDPALVGLGGAATEVADHAQRPPRQAGTVVKDEGDGGVKVAEFLAAQKFI